MQRLHDQTIKGFDMGACGNLRHHAAVNRMFIELRKNDIGKDPPFAVFVPFDDRSGCFVTARF